MMETDNLSRSQSIGQRDGSPGSHSPSRPMRQLEFNQAMSDFRHMFPETDEEVIEAVLRANSGMVDATIDQLLTMNIDAEFGKEDGDDDDDLPDHVLVEVEQEVLAQQQQQQMMMMQAAPPPPPPPPPAFRESSSRSAKKAQEAFASSKGGSEDCPPSYTEAVQSHLSHYRGSSSRSRHNHKHSPTPSGVLAGYNNNNGSAAASAGASGNTNAAGARMSSGGGGGGGGHHHHLHRMPRNGMQHLLDLGPESAPSATAGGANASSPSVTGSPAVVVAAPTSTQQTGSGGGGGGHASRSSRHHYHHHHHHHHPQRASNHHRRKGLDANNPDVVASSSSSSPHKSSSRPGRNLLASMTSAQSHNSNNSPSSSSYTHHELASDEFGYRPPRKGSFDNNDYSPDSRQEKSPQRWRYGGRESTSIKRPAFRNWNPPLLGTLPDDFLRLTPRSTSPNPTHSSKHSSSLQRTMSALGPERPRFLTSPATSSDHHHSHRQTASPDVGQMSSSFRHTDRTTTTSSSSSSSRPHRSLSFAGHSSHRQPPPRRAPTTLHPAANLAQHEFSSDILQERLKENERRRHLAASNRLDPELTQYLEDERLAILMQNSEFLQTLRGDRSFMMALEQDHSGGELEEPTAATTTSTSSSLGDTLTSTDVTFEPVNPNGVEVEEEGYGDDGRQTLEAFPFSKQLPPPNTSEDMELRKKLKHMGKASKKQFAALARKFFSKRRKKNAHQILKESQAPSMMNLLDNEDEEEDDDDNNTAENGTNGGLYSDSYGTSSGSGNLRNSWNERSGRHFDEV